MEADEEGTLVRLLRLWTETVEPEVARHSGWIVKRVGDGLIVAFDEPAAAMACAIAIQSACAEPITSKVGLRGREKHLSLRMGLHISDVLLKFDDIYGEGVNVAARLQAYAQPGDIVISKTMYAGLEPQLSGNVTDLGDLYLKNMSRPIPAICLRSNRISALVESASLANLFSKPRVAVLPFRLNLTSPEDAWFADGVVEEIIRSLGTAQDLFVVTRGSTLGFTDPHADTHFIATQLGIRYLLRGSVRRQPGRIRLTVELADAETGVILWGDRFDGADTDLFKLQDHISAEVAIKVAPWVRICELKHSLRKHPESLNAYDFTLRALDQLYRLNYPAFCRTRGFLQQAMEADPDYGTPYAYAAQWHIFRVGQRWSSDPDADAQEAARLARAAIERDNTDALALALCGHVHAWLLRQYDEAHALFKRALDCNSNCAVAWNLSSCTSSYLGNGADAIYRAKRSLALSPHDGFGFYNQTALTIGNYVNETYEQAVISGQKGVFQNPSYGANMRFLAASLVALGRLDEARAVAGALMGVQPSFSLSSYKKNCPFRSLEDQAVFLQRLRMAGLPD